MKLQKQMNFLQNTKKISQNWNKFINMINLWDLVTGATINEFCCMTCERKETRTI